MDGPSLVVRPARSSDLDGIAALRTALGELGDVRAETRAAHARDDVVLVLAAEGGRILGAAIGRHTTRPPVWAEREIGELPLLALDPAIGASSGAALLDAMSRALARSGARSLVAEVPAGPGCARDALERAGFTPWMGAFEVEAPPAGGGRSAHVTIHQAERRDVDRVHAAWLAMLAENAALDPRYRLHPEASANERRRIEQLLDACDRAIVVLALAADGTVVGAAAGERSRRRRTRDGRPLGILQATYVVPADRRRGTASALAGAVLRGLFARRAARVELYVVARNVAARAFWSSLGARPVRDLLERPAADASSSGGT